ncbi:hypothetical protein RIVM261_042320 [Rivularia sp. IAM M-261]|nr:hypothetical protein RIVM261_042320 [Rivularia sp. IAM M-261]
MAMRSCKIGLGVLICLLAVVSTSLSSSLTMVFTASRVLAQSNTDRKAEADRLNELGLQQAQASQYEIALQSWEQALKIYREIKHRKGEGAALGNLAIGYNFLGNYPKAIEYQEQSLAIAREIKDRKNEVAALTNLGLVYDALGNYAKAIEYHEKSLFIAREIKDRNDEGVALNNLGTAYHALGNYPKAIEYYQQRLALARQIKNRNNEGTALSNIGLAYYNLGNYPKAIEYQQQSLVIAREIKHRLGEVAVLNNLGLVYDALGNYSKAIKYHQQSLAIAREIKDRLGESQSLNNLGLAFYKQGNFALAESHLIEAVKFKESLRGRELNDSEKISIFDTQRNTYNTLQKVFIAQNKIDAALEIAERSRARAFVELLASRLTANAKDNLKSSQPLEKQKNSKNIKLQNTTFVQDSIYSTSNLPVVFTASQVSVPNNTDRKAEADRFFNQGIQQFQTSQFEAGLRSWQQALQIYREIKDSQSEGKALGNLGNAYYSLGNYPNAIDYYQQSLAIAKEIKDRKSERQSLGNLGLAYDSLGNYSKAIEYHQQSLAIAREIKDRQGEGQSLGNLGLAYDSLGNYPKAIDYHEQSLVIAKETQNRRGESAAMGNLGNAYFSLGDYQKAIDYHQQSLIIAREIKDRKGEGDTLSNLGNAYFSLGEYQKANDFYQQSLVIAKEIKNRKGEGSALGNLGRVYQEQGNYQKAIQYHQQRLIIAREIGNSEGESNALGNLGIVYYYLEDYARSIEYSQQFLSKAREIKYLEGEGIALNNLGFAFYKSGYFAAAEKTLFEGIKVYESLRNAKLNDTNKISIFDTQRSAYNTLQKVLIAQKKTNAALEIAERSRARAFVELLASRLTANANDDLKSPPLEKQKIQKNTKLPNTTFVQNSISPASNLPVVFTASQMSAPNNTDRKAEAEKVMQQGREQLKASQFSAALQSWQQALLIYHEIKDRQGEGKTLGNLGLAYHFLGDYRKAIEYYQQSLPILREIKDSKTEGIVLSNLGNTYDSLGDYHKAIEYNQQSLKIAQEIKDRQGEGAVFGNLGNNYFSLGDYRKAIEYHQQHLKIALEVKDREGEGAAFGNLGSIYNTLGDYPKAIEYHQKHLKIAQEIKNRLSEKLALGNLGLVYHSLGDNLKAIEYQQQSLKIAQEIQHRQGESQSLGNIGIAYLALGNYPKAIEYQQQSLKIAQEIQDRKGQGNALNGLGNIYYRLGDYPQAIEYQQQRLKIAQKIEDRVGEGAALNNLGLTYYKQGNLKLAENILFEGIKVLESLRGKELKDSDKVSLFDTQSSVYRILQQVLTAQNKHDASLEIAERGRARAFVELLASQVSSNPQEQLLNPPNIDQIKQTAKAQNATLVQYSIITDDFKVAGRQETKESELYIWVIKPTGEVTFRKANLKPLWQKENINLNSLVISSRQSINVRSRGIQVSYKPSLSKGQNNLKRLHKLLIDPIADLLPKKETDKVIFIPQNSLFLVPFPALQNEKGKYLIEKHTILTSPSIQVLDLTRQQRQKLETRSQKAPAKLNYTSPLIVGNPTMPKVAFKIGDKPQQLTPLPGAEKEAKAIASLFNTQALVGNQATETNVLQHLPQAEIIHFATHGLFDDIRGLDSAIALAPENPNSLSSPLSKEDKKRDGLLTAEEILGMKINADLVVLSACDTGRGRITGDGVIGLSRSLITAGTPSVIVSLWAVDDGSTAFLMTEFYQNLQKKLDKATALRNAMLTAKKKYSSPSQWAAFTLIGEAE